MRQNFTLFFLLLSFIAAPFCNKKTSDPTIVQPPVTTDSTFKNPLLSSGPDPWVFKKDSFYYYTHTLGNRIALWKTKKISDLKNAPVQTVWSAPATGPNSRNIWAPEIHFINNKWYAYYAADRSEERRVGK